MRIPAWVLIVGVVVVFGVTGLLSLVSFSVARQLAIESGRVFSSGPAFEAVAVTAPTATPTPQAAVEAATPDPAASIATAVPTPTVDPAAAYVYDDPRRVTILLLGIDQRTALNDPGPFRSDTMMVVSIDPVRKTAGVLSIPRDLWVAIPGFQQGRINTANYLGDLNSYPGGGPALAAETVRQVLGLTIDKYVLINFDVFLTLVNAVAPNGVEICVNEFINDTAYPDAGNGIITVTFEPGCQTLAAERLLQYARTRHGNSDFDRARRQQAVLQALQTQVLSVGGLASFVGQAPMLWEQLGSSVKTNMSLTEALELSSLVLDIPRENVRFGVIDYLYADPAMTSANDEVLVLRTNSARFLLQQLFNPEQNLSIGELRALAEAESASIVVYNNTAVSGLAGQTRDWLAGKGITVTDIGNIAAATDAPSTVEVYSGKLWTARYLAAVMGLSADRVVPGRQNPGTSDIGVIVGTDVQGLLNQQ